MSKFHFVIAVILSTYHVSYAGRLTRQCKAINGTCGGKDLTCDGMFGTGWTSYGKCCGERPCCKFQCDDIQPQKFPNGTVIINGQEIDATANFSCESGFSLNGKMVITCTESGWDGDIPKCIVQCDDIQPQKFPNGTVIITGQEIGATANFSCESGFSLNGKMVITCTESGWDGDIPKCVVQCEDIKPQQFPNGTVSITGQDIGATVSFSCDSGFGLNGTMVITCTDSGWNGDIPKCIDPCDSNNCAPRGLICRPLGLMYVCVVDFEGKFLIPEL